MEGREVRPRKPAGGFRSRLLRRLLAISGFVWLLLVGAYHLGSPLSVPVQGVRPRRLVSTFGAPRGGGRRKHEGTDIFAHRRTPVRSAGWGVVLWRGDLSLGGKVLLTFGRRGVLCYYAHLDGCAPGIGAGDWLREGELVGYVGKTGNARTTRPHLHFETRPAYRFFAPVDPVSVLR